MRGRWKFVISRSTTAKRRPGWRNSAVRPANSPLAAALSNARTVVVPMATTRRAAAAAAHVDSGTR